jgi:aldose sugar dehydrogenase
MSSGWSHVISSHSAVPSGRPRRTWHAAVALLSVLVASSLPLGTALATPTPVGPMLQPELYARFALPPISMVFLGPDDMLVLQKNDGQVRRVISGTPLPEPVLDLAVNSLSERGLLGSAINTEVPPKVFLYYTESSTGEDTTVREEVTGNRLVRYTWNAASGKLEDPLLLLELPVFGHWIHNGGSMFLGPTPTPGGPSLPGDGSLLHLVVGDANRNGQLQNNVEGVPPEDTGVILRVLQDGAPAPDNPFQPYCGVTTSQTCTDDESCPEGESCLTQVARYYAYGVRNSFGIARDPVTGSLWQTENGQNSYDEINLVPPGFNSGWRKLMGPLARNDNTVDDLFHMPGAGVTYSDPEFSWLEPVAPIAILFPFGSALGPEFDSVALVSDNNNASLYRLPLNAQRDGFDLTDFPQLQDLVADGSAEAQLLTVMKGIRVITDMQVGPDNEVYVVSLFERSIYRLRVAPSPTAASTATPSPTATSTATPSPTATSTATPPQTATSSASPSPSPGAAILRDSPPGAGPFRILTLLLVLGLLAFRMPRRRAKSLK